MTSVQDYILKNRDMFELVQDVRDNPSGTSTSRNGEHTMLNYGKILDDMINYLEGFQSYKRSGEKKYKHKVITSTYGFYNAMFTSDKYRKNITLSEFASNNFKFVEKSKKLNTLIKQMRKSVDNEVLNVARISENQYKKLAKVNRDDMKIYLWLVKGKSISDDLREFYSDNTSPVMHKIKK